MVLQRFVEAGRIAYIQEGQYRGKLVSIVDVIDANRCLIDGPESNVPRCQINLKSLHLTKFKISIPYTGSTKVIRKAWINSRVEEKWRSSLWGQKVENKNKRRNMNDFARFKVGKAKQIYNKLRTNAFTTLKNNLKS
ncbi:hypothetical protein HCN44_000582 [Aphidius gifuensis]|uniref:Large ribosomal subunit protein eL14 n=1 Tax=Aphidius gifuensis TaxID=684658 RepID=A0A834XQM3_APHGI|nr:hypothetical protein HCN44_000582 [Aphidius gifuensis]